MASTGDRPYDPYIPAEPAAGGAAQPAPGNQRTAALQAVSNCSFRRRQICRWTDLAPMKSGFDTTCCQSDVSAPRQRQEAPRNQRSDRERIAESWKV